MTRKRDRAFALFGAILFFLTSIALTVSIIIQMSSDSGNNATNSQQQQDATTKKEGDMLAGTKLEGYEPVDSVPELRTEDTVEGTGEEVKEGANLTVDYTGALAKTGVIFESSKDDSRENVFKTYPIIKFRNILENNVICLIILSYNFTFYNIEPYLPRKSYWYGKNS